MTGVSCIHCGAPLKVEITGGTFHVREGSTLDDLNFEKVNHVNVLTAELDDDVMLTVNVTCSADPSHTLFGYAVTAIKENIYYRLETGARRLRVENT